MKVKYNDTRYAEWKMNAVNWSPCWLTWGHDRCWTDVRFLPRIHVWEADTEPAIGGSCLASVAVFAFMWNLGPSSAKAAATVVVFLWKTMRPWSLFGSISSICFPVESYKVDGDRARKRRPYFFSFSQLNGTGHRSKVLGWFCWKYSFTLVELAIIGKY